MLWDLHVLSQRSQTEEIDSLDFSSLSKEAVDRANFILRAILLIFFAIISEALVLESKDVTKTEYVDFPDFLNGLERGSLLGPGLAGLTLSVHGLFRFLI
jgi:hypothetical protein